MSFDADAFAMASDVADASISWTNRVSTNAGDAAQSGHSIVSTALAVPEPSSFA